MDSDAAGSPADSPAGSPSCSPSGSPSGSRSSSPALSSLEGCSSDEDAGRSDVDRGSSRKRARAHSPLSDAKAASRALSKIEQHESNAQVLEDAAAVLTQSQRILRTHAAALSNPALGSPLTHEASNMIAVAAKISAAARNEVEEAARCRQTFLSEQQKRLDAMRDFMAQFTVKADALQASRAARARAVDLTLDAFEEVRKARVRLIAYRT